MKAAVYRAYHASPHDGECKPAGCEVDHRFPRDLGGADVIANLWVQPFAGRWNAHDKDRLEAFAKRAVCAGKLTLPAARAMFAGDWRNAYRKQFGEK